MWDHSQILLSNNAGDRIGAGIQQAAAGFTKGINSYWEQKKQKEKEEATIDWLNQNEGAVHQLFPQLAQVKDPAERKKVIRAGIKGAGLENLVQVKSHMENQKRQQEQMQMQKEMQASQIAQNNAQTEQMQAMMQDREMDGRALRYATGKNAGLHQQIMSGQPVGIDPAPEPDRANLYMSGGGKNPALIQAMMKERPFVPSAVELPGGGRMLMTSPHSAVPDPAMKTAAQPDKTSEYERIVNQLDESGAMEKKPEDLTAKEKSLMARLTALNKRGSGMSAEEMAAAITGPGAGATQPAAAAGPVTVTTKAERDALPVGTSYVGPDGKIYIKK